MTASQHRPARGEMQRDDASGTRAPRRHLASTLFALATLPALLAGCGGDDPQDGATASESQTPEDSNADTGAEGSDAEGQEAEQDEGSTPEEGGSDDAGDTDAGDGPESSEELGSYFSEDEACMSVGMIAEGLRTDLEDGFEAQAELDDARTAVEQTAEMVPADLEEPMNSLVEHLDSDVESLDEGAVSEDLDTVDAWMEDGFCEGEFHNQFDDHAPGSPDDSPGDSEDDGADSAST